MSDDGQPPNRLERRKQRTRAALIKAAQDFIAAGRLSVPVQDISQAADVGVGSFYNHFESKEQLFEVAVNEVLDALGAVLDTLTDTLEDPAEMFAQSYRLCGRLLRQRPDMSRVLLNNGLALITSERGLAPRARRDIANAAAAGKFQVADPQLAVAVVGGALLGLAQLLHDEPQRDECEATDQVTEDVLLMLGLSRQRARKLCQRPLPDLDELMRPDSAA
jgi:AcrR family transcriptional regulator